MIAHLGWNFPDADEHMWRQMRSDGYQRDHLDKALEFVMDRRCACDGGAHVGQFTKPLSALFERVIAVEPAQDTYECLMANVRRFNLTNVEPLNVALSDRPGTVRLELDAKQSARKNTGGRYAVHDKRGVIRCETIDGWNLPHLSFLKLDVEGSELSALEGAALTLKRCKPVVLWEDKGFGVRLGEARYAPHLFLESLGYEHKVRVGHDEIWAVKP